MVSVERFITKDGCFSVEQMVQMKCKNNEEVRSKLKENAEITFKNCLLNGDGNVQ